MKDKLDKLVSAYTAQIEAQKQAAMGAAGTGRNVELILMVGQVLDRVVKDIEAILKETEDAQAA